MSKKVKASTKLQLREEPPVSYSDDDYSDTSSDSETDSDADAVQKKQQKKKVIKKRSVDAKTYHKEQAAAEWKRATSGPAPAPQAKTPVAKKPARAGVIEIDKNVAAASKRPPESRTGRLVEAAEDMARWFKGSETSALALDDGLTVTQPASNNMLPKAGRLAKGKEFDDAPMGAIASAAATTNKPSRVGQLSPSKATGTSASTTEPKEEQLSEAAANYKLGDYADEKEEANPSTEPEEGKVVSRADFLSMLDLLGDDDDPTTKITSKKVTATTKADPGAMERSDTTESSGGLKRQASSTVHVDAFNWEAETRLNNEKQQKDLRAQGKKEKDLLHSGKGATNSSTVGDKSSSNPLDDTTFNPAAALEAYSQAKDNIRREVEHMYDFQNTLEVFESVLTGKLLNGRINDYLEVHHKEFLHTAKLRANGEFSHNEFNVFSMYSEQVQEWTVAEMQRRLKGAFDVETFVTELFDQEQSRLDIQDDLEDELEELGLDVASVPAVGSTSLLSLEAWEVLLSLLQFDNFTNLMDEFIHAFYGVDDKEGRMAGSAASVAKSSSTSVGNSTPPPSLSTSSSVQGKSKSMEATKPKLSGLGTNVMGSSSAKFGSTLGSRPTGTPSSSSTAGGGLGPVRGSGVKGVPNASLGQRATVTPPARPSVGSGTGSGGNSTNSSLRGLREVRNLPKP